MCVRVYGTAASSPRRQHTTHAHAPPAQHHPHTTNNATLTLRGRSEPQQHFHTFLLARASPATLSSQHHAGIYARPRKNTCSCRPSLPACFWHSHRHRPLTKLLASYLALHTGDSLALHTAHYSPGYSPHTHALPCCVRPLPCLPAVKLPKIPTDELGSDQPVPCAPTPPSEAPPLPALTRTRHRESPLLPDQRVTPSTPHPQLSVLCKAHQYNTANEPTLSSVVPPSANSQRLALTNSRPFAASTRQLRKRTLQSTRFSDEQVKLTDRQG